MDAPCPRIGRLIRGCKFSPRYDLSAPADTNWTGDAYSVIRAIEASRPKTYVHDICERCGKIVKRGGA